MKLINPDDLKLAIRDDADISGRNYARMKMHINDMETVDLVRCKDCVKTWCFLRQELGKDGFCSGGIDKNLTIGERIAESLRRLNAEDA